MTKVQVRYSLSSPLDDTLLERIADAHGHYGFQRIQVAPELDKISVEYDASRLTPAQVESTLRQAGIPIGQRV